MSFSLPRSPLFSPEQSLFCGQAFRWRKVEDGCWQGVASGRFLRLRETGDSLEFSCDEEEFRQYWENYFDLKDDQAARLSALSAHHPVLAKAAALYPGIRILRQDPWEALCSFLISQNNNIPRICGIIDQLCRLAGEEIAPGCFSFPGPQALAALSEEELSSLRAGYRAKYLKDAARKVLSGEVVLSDVAAASPEKGRLLLEKISGIGPKVADCVLLYGFHKTDCFPMDVWMKRAMKDLLPELEPAIFGDSAGLAQQLIFHYSREHRELFS